MKKLILLLVCSLVFGYTSTATPTASYEEKILTDKDFLTCVDAVHELMKVGRLTKDAESTMKGFLETKKEDDILTKEEISMVFTTSYETLERIHNTIGNATISLLKKYPEIKDYDAEWAILFEKGFKARGIDISTMYLFGTPCDGPRAFAAAKRWFMNGWVGSITLANFYPPFGALNIAYQTYYFVTETLDAGCGD